MWAGTCRNVAGMELSCRAPHPVTVMLKLAVDQSGGVDDRSALKSERLALHMPTSGSHCHRCWCWIL